MKKLLLVLATVVLTACETHYVDSDSVDIRMINTALVTCEPNGGLADIWNIRRLSSGARINIQCGNGAKFFGVEVK